MKPVTDLEFALRFKILKEKGIRALYKHINKKKRRKYMKQFSYIDEEEEEAINVKSVT